jgi:hypothetical protein
VSGFEGVVAVVLSQAILGSAALLWLSPLWREVKLTFFVLTGGILLVLALAAWGSARAAVVAGSGWGEWAVRSLLATGVALGLSVLLLLAGRPALGRGLGLASVGLAAAAVVALAGTARQAPALALFQLATGSAFLGAATDGLLIGHWYLTDRRLTRGPINRFTLALLVAVAVEAVAVLSGGFGSVTVAEVNPLLSVGGTSAWIALGMTACTALVALVTRKALEGERTSAVQSATGFFYVAFLTAFVAEIAAKLRFLPA